MPIASQLEMLGVVALAMALGALIGFERERVLSVERKLRSRPIAR